MICIREHMMRRICAAVLLAFALNACQEGRSFQGTLPKNPPTQTAKNTPESTPVPRKKPKVPKKPVRGVKKPAPNIVAVRKGDTIYALSRRHGVSVRSLIKNNKLRPPYLLKPGQRLRLPQANIFTVKKGDTVYSVSRKYGVNMAEFVRLNGLKYPYRLAVGQKLHTSKKARQVALAPPPPRSRAGFMWPVRGKVISHFGPRMGGFHNDGINIQANAGSPVRAADAGIVVHADNKLKGFGNLILIKHDNGWMTAYAHTSLMLVQKGQRVARGQSIAKVGRTGRVASPQLHFEMRKGARAVNPETYLKS